MLNRIVFAGDSTRLSEGTIYTNGVDKNYVLQPTIHVHSAKLGGRVLTGTFTALSRVE